MAFLKVNWKQNHFIFTGQCIPKYCVLSLPLCSVIKFVPSFHLHDQLFLPFIQKKEEFASELLQGETLTRHWLVSDMFAFENVGFSMTVGSIKYLACADCDRGPIGWHDITDNTKFYVAVERVEHIKMWHIYLFEGRGKIYISFCPNFVLLHISRAMTWLEVMKGYLLNWSNLYFYHWNVHFNHFFSNMFYSLGNNIDFRSFCFVLFFSLYAKVKSEK